MARDRTRVGKGRQIKINTNKMMGHTLLEFDLLGRWLDSYFTIFP